MIRLLVDRWPIGVSRTLASVLVVAAFCAFVGCGDGSATSDSTADVDESRDVELRVFLIGQGARFGDNMQRLWSAQGRGNLVLTELTVEDYLDQHRERPPADVLIYPQSLLGELVRRNAVAELPKHVTHAESLRRSDVLDLERRVSATWGELTMGFSLGSPQLVLLYRKDLLEAVNELPPVTWEDYQRVAKKLIANGTPTGADETWLPVVEPLHPDWSARMLLARSASYVRHPSRFSDVFDFVTMVPTINRTPFVRALTELKDSVDGQASELQQITPDQASDRIFNGQCAMAIGIVRPSESRDFPESTLSSEIGITALPAARQVYSFSQDEWESRSEEEVSTVTLFAVDGCLASVVNLSRRSAAAQDFLLWLAGPDESAQIIPWNHQSAPFRVEHLDRVTPWCDPRMNDDACTAYRNILERELTQPLWMAMPRLPGADEYLRALGDAVTATLVNDLEPAAALDEAANKWQSITRKYGESEQRQAYEKSLLLK